MVQTILNILRKEFIQTFRDKRMLLPLFVAPVLQLLLFGYAVNLDINHIPFAILDYDHTQGSRTLIASFHNTEYFDIKFALSSSKEIDDLLQRRKIQAALVIPDDFAKNLKNRRKAPLQVIIDGTDANSATIIQNYISLIAAKYSESILIEALGRKPQGMVIPEPRIWYNPELRSSLYFVPGVICMILLITTLTLTSMAITREREIGTLEQLIVSPIKPWELILGKTLPFVIIGFMDVVLILAAGKLIFNVPIRGSLLYLFAMCFLFVLTTLSLGLLISTISRTQQQAFMLAFFFAMPAMLLSGIFTSIESMPKAIQVLTYLNALRYFGTAVRAILLKGNGISILWPETLALFIFGVLALTISSLRFRKYME